ncbi:hypothetical protein JTE90_006366 [Oedothorax gibbosus]|uniref:Major facilitator superfamily (MFS) profile domain-containing protein n=1 Tax=Oedothorax gibbosus TaxID=931172 RepID=A0AAV6VYJ8_9ARAC|nr:hypothetical protein JTE90_006366 [Oedothorax gibbosus]
MDRNADKVAKNGSTNGMENGSVGKKAETKSSTKEWVKLATLAFGNFCSGACLSLQAPFFPKEAELKGSSPTTYGFILGTYEITVFLTAPIFGMLVRYISPTYLLNIGVMTVGTACVLFGTLDLVADSTTFIALAFALRALEGVGSALTRVSANTVVASQYPERLGKVYALLQMFSGIGVIAGPTLGGALYDIGGYGLPFYAIGSGFLVDAIIIHFLLPKVETTKIQEKVSFIKLLLHPTSFIFLLSAFTGQAYLGFSAATLEPHLRQFDISGFVVGLVFSITGILYAISAVAYGWILDKKIVSAEFLTVGGCFVIVVSIVLMGPAPFIPLGPDLWYIFMAQALFGIGLGAKFVSSFTGMLTSASNREFPDGLSTYGIVTSAITSATSLGSFVGPSLGGYLLEQFQYRKATMFILFQEIILIILLTISLIKSMLCGNADKLSLRHELEIPPKNHQIISEKYVTNCNIKKMKDTTKTVGRNGCNEGYHEETS